MQISKGTKQKKHKQSKKERKSKHMETVNTVNTSEVVVPVTPATPVTATPAPVKEKIQGRKPNLEKIVSDFIDKHGPQGKYGSRFNTQRQADNLDAVIAKLTALRQSVVIPAVVVAPVVVAPVAPVAPVEAVNTPETAPAVAPAVEVSSVAPVV